MKWKKRWSKDHLFVYFMAKGCYY